MALQGLEHEGGVYLSNVFGMRYSMIQNKVFIALART